MKLFGKSTRGKRLKSDDRILGDLPFVTAGEAETGISAYIGNNVEVFEANTVTIDMFGSAKYRGYQYGADDHVAVVHTEHLSKRAAMFLSVAIESSSHNGQFDYSRNFYAKDADALNIMLPVRDGEIDFDFIEEFVAELEATRLAELEAYLEATGLRDYTLTPPEIEALNKFETLEWNEYQLGVLFDHIKQGQRLKKDDQRPGDIPFVMSGVTNTGVVGYISNPVASFPKDSITIDIFGNSFYRSYAYGAGDDTGAYWNDSCPYSSQVLLFISSSINKTLAGRFSYGHKLRSSRSLDITIKLPQKNDEIDFDFITPFISAIKKLIIKDVVDFADRRIAATKQAIAS